MNEIKRQARFAGIFYVAFAFTSLVLPQFADISGWLGILMLGEFPMVIWLLVWGARGTVPINPIDDLRAA